MRVQYVTGSFAESRLSVSILASVLVLLFVLSIPLTATIILTYVFSRLVVLTRSDGRAGIGEWATEIRDHFNFPGHAGIARPQKGGNDSGYQGHLHHGDMSTTLVTNKQPHDDVSPAENKSSSIMNSKPSPEDDQKNHT